MSARRLMGRAALLLVAAALVVGYTWPYFKGLDSTSAVREWIVTQSAVETTRRSLIKYQQLPQWDPWRCGGAPHLANPLVDALSPWAALQVALGVSPALRLHVYFHLVIALLGAWWWARRRGLGPIPAAGAALTFGLSGFFGASVAWGYAFLLPCAYLPLLMIAYEAARERLLAATGAGAVIALMVFEGGFAPAQLALLLLLLRVLVDVALAPRRAARPLLILLVAVGAGAGLAAPKLLPAMLHALAQPLPSPRADALTLGQLFTILLGRDTGHFDKGFTFERYEYFGYVGPLVVGAALWAIWRAREAPYKELVAVAGLLCLLLLGDQGDWSPYRWLVAHDLPRWLVAVPSRSSVALVLLLAMMFAHALGELEGRLEAWRPGSRLRHGVALLVVALAVDLFVVVQGQWRHQPFAGDPIAQAEGPFMLVDGDRASQFRLQRQNQGTIRCHQLTPVAVSKKLRRGSSPTVWLERADAGQVTLERFSPNRLWIDLDLTTEATLLVNQNAAAGWRVHSEVPAEVTAVDGLLAARVQAGKGRLVLSYLTPGLVPGAVIGGVSALLLIAIWLVRWRTTRRDPYALDP